MVLAFLAQLRDGAVRCKPVLTAQQEAQIAKAQSSNNKNGQKSSNDNDSKDFNNPSSNISPAHSNGTEPALFRVLQLWDLVGFGMGCTIGAGIFVSLGQAAKFTGVHSLHFSFIVAALGCLGSGLAYAEMSTRIPQAGSAYSYCYAIFGEFVAFQTGMLIVLGNIVSTSAVTRSFCSYLRTLLQDLGMITISYVDIEVLNPTTNLMQTKKVEEGSIWFDMPLNYAASEGTSEDNVHDTDISRFFSISLLSCVFIIGLGILQLKGMKDTSFFNKIMQVFNVGIVLIFVIAGFYYSMYGELKDEKNGLNLPEEPTFKHGFRGV